MKIIDFLVAEDIRNEVGNKHSVMGLFTDSIAIGVPAAVKWPIAFRLAMMVRLECEPGDPKEFTFCFRILWGAEELARFDGGGAQGGDESSILTLPLVAPAVPLKGPGAFSFHIEIKAGDRVLLSQHLRPMGVVVNTVEGLPGAGP